MYWSPPAAAGTRLPMTWASQVVSGLGTSAIASPLWVGPYGGGAWAKSSCQLSAFAGRITMVLSGTVTTWPFTFNWPPSRGRRPRHAGLLQESSDVELGAGRKRDQCGALDEPAISAGRAHGVGAYLPGAEGLVDHLP